LALYQERHVKPTRATHTTRIANELLFKLGLRLSPRTVRKYLPRSRDCRPKTGMSSKRWRTFVRNHAQMIMACDFCVAVATTLRNLYLLVVMEHATRTILHANDTGHPTAVWTLQQLRAAIPAEYAYRFLMHARYSMFSQQFDQSVHYLGLRGLKTQCIAPKPMPCVSGGWARCGENAWIF
jgi:putative transposase